MSLNKTLLLLFGTSLSLSSTSAWLSPFATRRAAPIIVARQSTVNGVESDSDSGSSSSTWSEADNWSLLSLENERDSTPDSEELYNQDLAWNAAREFEAASVDVVLSQEDRWISSMVDEIHNSFATLDEEHVPLYDTSFDESDTTSNEIDDMSNEIAMLVRCNEHPEDLLVSEGRALAPLTENERNNVFQLVSIQGNSVRPTAFLKESASKLFYMHAAPDPVDGVLCLDRKGVANWMTTALKTEERRVSAHDSRVVKTLSEFSSYGSGRLLEEDFEQLYLMTIAGVRSNENVTWERHLALRQPYVDAVWRDLRNHGILSPIEQERKQLAEQLKLKGPTNAVKANTIMDECEILEWDYSEKGAGTNPEDRMSASGSMSSHKMVEMAPNSNTPLWVRDGDFVFIDEESCIGCAQCVNISPDSFLMLESGRARTFDQRHTPDVKQAVTSCPVDCMHPVSYKELQEFEKARDEGDGRDDHKHLGHRRGPTPLYVAGIDSDNNHRTSWYHTLKEKCLVSSQCPQKGCYDCPKYSKAGDNPFFQQRQKEENHIRAEYFVENSDIDVWRNSADL